jgi:heptosyltransferase-1
VIPSGQILVVRLGALGDIIHTLPAVASLKHSFPGFSVAWAVEPKWTPILENNPFVDRVVEIRRDSPGTLWESWRGLRAWNYDIAVDFQGLIKSALVASLARPQRIYGFRKGETREQAATLFYSDTASSRAAHIVDKNLDLAVAAGAVSTLRVFPIPVGQSESPLPDGDFVLASPLAGWRSKQWPIEYYSELATRLHRGLGVPLVLDGPASAAPLFGQATDAVMHISSLRGLIYATRRAAAVVGVDSGPLHIADALGKPGVAIFGPTDPARNGPYGDSLQVLRARGAVTSYRRSAAIDDSMRQIAPDEVFELLQSVLRERRHSAGCLS